MKDGRVKCFGRNSAFAYVQRVDCSALLALRSLAARSNPIGSSNHFSKHTKPYVCKEPGCPYSENRRGLTRRDALERHLLLVKHTHNSPLESSILSTPMFNPGDLV